MAFLASCDAQRGEASSDEKGPGAEAPVLVRVGKFDHGEISDRLPVAADLEAVKRADVLPEVSGVVREILHREGDRVKRGDAVVRLVDEHLKLLVEQKRLLATQAKGKIAQADVARREGQELIRQKKLQLEKVEAEYERTKKLSEDAAQGLVSKEEVDVKRYAFEQAQIDRQTCILGGEKLELEHSQAVESQKLAEVDLRTAEYNLSQMTLRSPIDGAITYLTVKPGEMLSVSTRAFAVVDTSKLEARLHVPQRELSRIRAGLPVRILCEVFAEREFAGSIEVVSPVVDKDKGTVEVIVGVADPTSFLRPGMFVNAEIVLDTRKDAALVPKKAVSYENQEPIIFLVKDKTARRCVLKPGYSTKTHIEVLGLTGQDGQPVSPDDGALVEIGHNNLKEGSKVELESASKE